MLRSLSRAVCLLLTVAAAPAAGSSAAREVTYERPFFGQSLVFDKGYLFQLSSHTPSLSLFNPDGHLVFDVTLTAPDGSMPTIWSAAVENDGRAVAAVSYAGKPRDTRGALIFLDLFGQQTSFVPTGRYLPVQVCIAADHTIWTLGPQLGKEDNGREEREDYAQIRKYSSDGSVLGEYLPRSLFTGQILPVASARGMNRIRASADRIGMLMYDNLAGKQLEWVELEYSGKLLTRSKLNMDASQVVQLAFTSSGSLYRMASGTLSVWDRSGTVWKPAGPAPQTVRLVGADDDSLVFTVSDGRSNRLVWVPAK